MTSDRFRDKLSELPSRELSPAEADEFAEQVVDAWTISRHRRVENQRRGGTLAAVAAVLLGVAGLTWVLAPDPPPTDVLDPAPVVRPMAPTMAGNPTLDDDRIQASSGARYQITGTRSDRVVALASGTVLCDVDTRAPGEKFRVIVGDAMVKVTGTRFGVEAADGVLRAVWVEHGTVEVHTGDGALAVLRKGERWPPAQAPEPTPADPASAPTDPASAPAEVTPPATLAPISAEPVVVAPVVPVAPKARVGEALREGLELFDQGAFDKAAEAFAQEAALGTLHEDGLFWRALALHEAGRIEDATEAMQAFLDVYADSARAPDVHCLFGRLLHEQGDREGAAPHLAIAQKAHPGRCDLP
jgi:hypothetical protein